MAILPLQKRVKPRKKIYDLIIVMTSLILNLFQKIFPIRQVSELIKTFFNSALDNIPVSTFEWSLQGGQLLFTNLYISNNKLFSYVFVVVENSNVKVLCRSCSFDNWWMIKITLGGRSSGKSKTIFSLIIPRKYTLKIYLYLR